MGPFVRARFVSFLKLLCLRFARCAFFFRAHTKSIHTDVLFVFISYSIAPLLSQITMTASTPTPVNYRYGEMSLGGGKQQRTQQQQQQRPPLKRRNSVTKFSLDSSNHSKRRGSGAGLSSSNHSSTSLSVRRANSVVSTASSSSSFESACRKN